MSAVLWHIPISHYNEKARWALDWKGIDHVKRAPTPGAHMAVALWLTRGRHKTFPVLQIGGRTIGDSSAIIAALDEIQPEPRLIPLEPGERARALELEEFFDEELGPHIRLMAFHELRRDPAALERFTRSMLPARLASSGAVLGGATRLSGAFAQARYRVADEGAAAEARSKVLAALDRLDAELEVAGGEHLVGAGFTSADLTAASLFMPLVQPPLGSNPLALPEPVKRFRESLRERPGYRWVERTYERFRAGPGPQPRATSPPSPARP